MNDERMDEMLIEAARDYNAPGRVPREEMWDAIREARRATGDGRPATRDARRTASLKRFGMLAAAAVILTVGISIGRRVERTSTSVALPPAPTVAIKPTVVEPVQRDTLLEQAHEATRQTAKRVQELAAANVARPDSPVASRPSPVAPQPSLAYRLVVLQHLAGSEAMITSFRSSARGGQVDAQVASWAKELLSTTRLLEASDAGKDPVMKRLLEDLDLVISQIVQYTTRGVTDADELDLIEQSINKRGVITKLRSTIPARVHAAGT